jgi:hypothetical protein
MRWCLQVSAMAAMMSTIDSALISTTNLISRELLGNWLFFDGGKGAADPVSIAKTLKICKLISLTVVTVSVAVSLYVPEFRENPAIFTYMFSWLVSLLWQIGPTVVFGIFFDGVTGFMCIIGIVAGMATQITLFSYYSDQENFGSLFAYVKDSVSFVEEDHVTSSGAYLSDATDIDPEASPYNTLYIDMHLLAGLVNVATVLVLMILQNVLPKSLQIPDTTEFFAVPARDANHDGKHGTGKLTATWVNDRMSGARFLGGFDVLLRYYQGGFVVLLLTPL